MYGGSFLGHIKWEAHADEPGANKWIVFIAYVMGLSIGIHLLNLLVIPAIALYLLPQSKTGYRIGHYMVVF
jgi:hypothetical protein